MAIDPEIPGQRKAGEEATEETPVAVASLVDVDPRLSEITEEVKQSYRLTFTRGEHSATFEFESEPSDSTRAEYRKTADDIMDRLASQKTQELQDRRRPKS